MKQTFSSLLAGILFGAGLTISGMTNPEKVIRFLSFFEKWDHSLAFVMVGAIAVHLIGYRWIVGKKSPLFSADFQIPPKRKIDFRLIFGSSLFGIGWGLAGFCPGPALTSLVSLNKQPLIFVGSMLCGMLVFSIFQKRTATQEAQSLKL